MYKKINCKYNENGAWCNNKKIKRSLFGLGARCCLEFDGGKCELKECISIRSDKPKPGELNFNE